jgi:hypothetical protein
MDSFGRSVAWSEVSNLYNDIIDDNWFLMSSHAKVNLLTKFCFDINPEWEEELVECELNTQMIASHSVANRMNELEEDLMVKQAPNHNWIRDKGIYFRESKVHLARVHKASAEFGVNTLSYTTLESAMSEDVELLGLREVIENGSNQRIIEYLKVTYNSPRINGGRAILPEDLSVIDGCILVCERLWIPISRQSEAADLLHQGHRGVDKMIQRAAKGTCYWPGMCRSLELKRTTCEFCCTVAPMPARPGALPQMEPHLPFEMLTTDVGQLMNRKNFLAIADRFTGMVGMYDLKVGGTSQEIISHIPAFTRYFTD